MYCQTCNTLYSDDVNFCSQCGSKLTPLSEIDLRLAYYAKLATVLAGCGYRTDPRLLQSEDAAESWKWLGRLVAKTQAGDLPFLKPLVNRMVDSHMENLAKKGAIDGEMLYNQLAGIIPLFQLIAARHYLNNLSVVAVVEADKLSIDQAEARAEALIEALHRLPRRQKGLRGLTSGATNAAAVYCLYVFFDEEQGRAMTSPIISRCEKKKIVSWIEGGATVGPVVVIVPSREVRVKHDRLFALLPGWMGMINKKALVEAFP